MKNRDQLLADASEAKWFHAIDFGDFQSSGRFPADQRQNVTLFPVFELLKGLDVTDLDCLDIGAACGIVSFGLKHRGARYVGAVDIVRFKSLLIARELLGLDIDYRPYVRADRVSENFPDQHFDLIVSAGVLYHMFNPMAVIAESRLLIKQNGLFLLETAYLPAEEKPVILFNAESDDPFREAYTYWLPSESAICGMLKLCGFDILRTVKLQGPQRIAFLAAAKPFDQVSDRSALMERMHELGFGEQAYRPQHFSAKKSTIIPAKGAGFTEINSNDYIVDFPFHVDFPEKIAGVSIHNPKQADF